MHDNNINVPLVNSDAGVPRYASTDEMRSEFGDYRVSDNTENLSDSQTPDPIAEDIAKNDPSTEQIAPAEGE